MPSDKEMPVEHVPPRFERPSPFAFVVLVVALAFFIHGLAVSELTPGRLIDGSSELANFLAQAIPPATGRLPEVARATLETFEMALVGTAFGAVLSLPLALLAARNTSPHKAVYGATRALISFLRAVPDLAWGLIFVVAVGLGPAAGICAIAVDVVGFCGRFFAERIEEVEPGPMEALRATGATAYGVIAGSVVPAAFPSFVATTLFALESATRSAVVLGIVGAGGIGIELAVSMETLRYDEAFTIIIVIFLTVITVERISAAIRRRMI
jgi:phosphonate transport system permease protein